MRLRLLVLTLVVATASCSNIHTAAGRLSCPHYQHIGCLSDTLEKSCESDEGLGFVSQTARESVWMCCCPKPYAACDKSARDASCDAAMAKYMTPLTASTDRLKIREGIQLTRGALVAHGSCKDHFAPALPISTCGKDEGKSRSIARADLFCETVTWQWEQLGDGNPDELKANSCPIPATARPSPQIGNARKGNQLLSTQLPSAPEVVAELGDTDPLPEN